MERGKSRVALAANGTTTSEKFNGTTNHIRDRKHLKSQGAFSRQSNRFQYSAQLSPVGCEEQVPFPTSQNQSKVVEPENTHTHTK